MRFQLCIADTIPQGNCTKLVISFDSFVCENVGNAYLLNPVIFFLGSYNLLYTVNFVKLSSNMNSRL